MPRRARSLMLALTPAAVSVGIVAVVLLYIRGRRLKFSLGSAEIWIGPQAQVVLEYGRRDNLRPPFSIGGASACDHAAQ